MDKMEMSGLVERIAHIEGEISQINQRLGQSEKNFSVIWSEISSLRIEGRHEIRSLRRMTIGILILMWITIIGAIVAMGLIR